MVENWSAKHSSRFVRSTPAILPPSFATPNSLTELKSIVLQPGQEPSSSNETAPVHGRRRDYANKFPAQISGLPRCTISEYHVAIKQPLWIKRITHCAHDGHLA